MNKIKQYNLKKHQNTKYTLKDFFYKMKYVINTLNFRIGFTYNPFVIVVNSKP